jgi:Mg2+-importing ATPase
MVKKQNQPVSTRADRVKKRLLNAAGKNADTLLIQYDNTYDGYDPEQADDNRDEYGANIITRQGGQNIVQKLWGAFVNPFTIVLFCIAVISFLTHDIPAVVIVTSMVLISGILRFTQEFKSGRSAERLSEMVETTVTLQRRSEDEETEADRTEKVEFPMDEVVVGDIIHLAAGDMVPADVRILQAKDLFVNQSSLTGESEPVEKFAEILNSRRANPLDLNNLAFMGSNVISGSAVVMAIAVGDDTVMGEVAKSLQVKSPPTSFERGISSVSWVLIRFMMIMAPIVFFINGFMKGNWLEAFLFSVSIAVGLTPEMLPMIVSTNLAKGAVSMSKKRVIVKNLNSIQNFGAMDILCTDKTGTITQDKVILEYHLDVYGNDDDRILRHAFLNSYYQTGLKNLMDISIIEHARERQMTDLWQNYRKVDEIPFDFNRRRMSVVVADASGKAQLITKGAIEEMLSVSSYVDYQGHVEPLTDETREMALERCRKYNEDGLRVLGLAQKTNPSSEVSFSSSDESEMVLLGYLAFLDPPKDSTEEAIAALREYGVEIKVLTGDNDAVTKSVCKQVGIRVDNILLGSDIEAMPDEDLKAAAERVNVFAKLSPNQKARVVSLLREAGHTVGFMGDGINDAVAMKSADVGISVDTAVDIAKESANIILMEKDLMVLEEGVIEGRKIYANIIKYIKMTASSNFGNMLSVLIASAFLPFIPMLPLQILILNLIYDLSCTTIPWDNVDADYLKRPRKWDASSIVKFMLWIGPSSSVFDITTYAIMYFVICPAVMGAPYAVLGAESALAFAMLFHAGWFVESLWSQTLVIHMIRTPKIPFIQSAAAWQITALTTLGIAVGTMIPYTVVGRIADMLPMPGVFFGYLVATILCYMMLVTILKKLFVRRYGELL